MKNNSMMWFKFYPKHWANGNISFESYEIKGIYSDLMAFYFERNGDVDKKIVNKRFSDGLHLIDELEDSGIIQFDNDKLKIKFLDEQIDNFEAERTRNSANGKKSAEARAKKRAMIEGSLNSGSTTIEPKREEIEEKESIKQKTLDLDSMFNFDVFWSIYNKKTSKSKTESKFIKLKKEDQNKILKVVQDYVNSTPDVQYRKNPLTWLNQECWNDELETMNIKAPESLVLTARPNKEMNKTIGYIDLATGVKYDLNRNRI